MGAARGIKCLFGGHFGIYPIAFAVKSISLMSFGQRSPEDPKDQIYFLTEEDSHVAGVDAGRQQDESNGAQSQSQSQSAAFNPETKEINWECPCLGDLPRGPCGDAFKQAFSCFVFSEQKGADCIDQFRTMQDCFRQFPEYYAEQLQDEDNARRGDPQLQDHSSAMTDDSPSSSPPPPPPQEQSMVQEQAQ